METISAGAVIQALMGLAVMVLGWIATRQVARIDELEKSKADKEHMDKAIDELRNDMREHRAESREGFRRVFERLDTIADRIK